jgi:hypothetical protein
LLESSNALPKPNGAALKPNDAMLKLKGAMLKSKMLTHGFGIAPDGSCKVKHVFSITLHGFYIAL